MGSVSIDGDELPQQPPAIRPKAIAGPYQPSPSALPVLEQPAPVRSVVPPPPTPGRTLRWCRVFPAQYDHLGQVSDFVADLIESRPDRGKIIAGTAELTVTAIDQANTAGVEFFVVEVGWSGLAVRISAVAVAASGAIAGPVQSVYFGPAGAAGQRSPDEMLTDQVRAQEVQLTGRYPRWFIWFGEFTGEWWAMLRRPANPDRLVSAPTAELLASMLRGYQPRPA